MDDDDAGGDQPPKRGFFDKIMTVLYLDDSCGVFHGSIRNWFNHGRHCSRMGSAKVDSTNVVALSKDPAMLCIEQLDLSSL